MRFIDYYEVLQVSPSASLEIIKVSYRQLSKMYHPDTSNYEDKKFILIKEAYEVLSDKNKRSEYDELRKTNQKKNNSNIEKEYAYKSQKDTSNFSLKGIKTPFMINTWTVVGISILMIISFFIVVYIIGNSESDSTYMADENTNFETYDISLPKEDFLKIKTTEHILNYGEAYFDIYNGTNLTITSITIEINVKNDKGNIIDTRQFQKDVYIEPLSVQGEINITTGIEDLPPIGDNDLRIQSKYISWSYIDIIGDNLE